ncbi:Predicted PurR-regulated permease PerM [Desulfonauticus submarinus]|uniref:Predicted PurR-regulated permease PerM n=1 Tax=Desulfonauticus submarinus TaxID=206665 RepID=A0A1H0BTE6_9BACT|nr:AI-2E family transporter [Desulfonauticus submarinus]SDN48847.1 Predicted PurR-regulated permease PerM [Desulfonauticus submarinus]
MFNTHRPFQLFLLCLSLGLVFFVLRPFWNVLLLAIIFSMVLNPIYKKILILVKNRKNFASFLTLFLFFIFIFVPCILLLSALISQGFDIASKVNTFLLKLDFSSIGDSWINKLENVLRKFGFEKIQFLQQQEFASYLADSIKKISLFIAKEGGTILSNVLTFFTNTGLFFFMLFYFLRDLDSLLNKLKRLSPLPDEQEEKILFALSDVSKKVVIGNLLTALAQGIVGGIGLALVGLPAIFWGTLMAVTSLIPVVGTALVWLPAVGYLFLLGKMGASLFLALWSIILVGGIDNFLRPYLIGKGEFISPFFLFLAIIGGVSCFGFIGLIYGPLSFTFALVMLQIYELEFKEHLDNCSNCS